MTSTETIETVQESRTNYHRLNRRWWDLHLTLGAKHPQTLVWRDAAAAARMEAIKRFGKPDPKHPDCLECLARSVFDGPRHDPDPACASGKYEHCCCDICWRKTCSTTTDRD